jgi:hypothetical protein
VVTTVTGAHTPAIKDRNSSSVTTSSCPSVHHDGETIMMNMMLGAVFGVVKTIQYIHHD